MSFTIPLSIGPGSTLDELLSQILEAKDHEAVIRVLSRLQGPREEIFPFLVKILKNYKDPVVIAWLARDIGRKFPDAETIQNLLPLLHHNNDRVVANAMESIQNIGLPASYVIFVQLLRHRNHLVQSNALNVLVKWDKNFTIRAIQKMLGDGSDDALAISACHAIDRMGLSECLPILEGLKEHPVIGEIVIATIKTLRSSKPREAKTIIEPESDDYASTSRTFIDSETVIADTARTIIEQESADDSSTTRTIIDSGATTAEPPITIREPGPGPKKTPPGIKRIESFHGWNVIKEFPAVGGEADLYLVEKDHEQAVLKLYRRGIQPKEEVISRLQELSNDHPTLFMKILDFGRDPESQRFFELQEFFAGGSFADVLKECKQNSKKIAEDDVRALLDQLTCALNILHKKEIHHLDIKPDNIMIRSEKPLEVVLIDFGIASLLGQEFTMRATVRRGTPMYQSPESLAGVIGEKSDWWSVGMVMLVALSGEHPFENIQMELIHFNLIDGLVPIPETLSDAWKSLVKGLLTPATRKRWGCSEILLWQRGKISRVYYDDELSKAHARNAINKKDHEFEIPLTFQRGKYYGRKSLFNAFISSSEAWEKGVKLLGRGNLKSWFEENRCFEEAQAIQRIFENQDSADRGLFEVVYTLVPEFPLTWRGQRIDDEFVKYKFEGILDGTVQTKSDEFSKLLCSSRLFEDYFRFTQQSSSVLSSQLQVVYQLLVSCPAISPEQLAESFVWLISKPVADSKPFGLLKKAINDDVASVQFLNTASKKGMEKVLFNLGLIAENDLPLWNIVFSIWTIITNVVKVNPGFKGIVLKLLPDDSEDLPARLISKEKQWLESGGSAKTSEDKIMSCFCAIAMLKSPFSSRKPFLELHRAILEKEPLSVLIFNMLAIGKEFQDIVFCEETTSREKNEWLLALVIFQENQGFHWVIRAIEFLKNRASEDFSLGHYQERLTIALQTRSQAEAFQILVGGLIDEENGQFAGYPEFIRLVFKIRPDIELKKLVRVVQLFQDQPTDQIILPGFIQRIVSGEGFSGEELFAAESLLRSKEFLQKEVTMSSQQGVVEEIDGVMSVDGFSYDEACLLGLVPLLERILQLHKEVSGRAWIARKDGARPALSLPEKHGFASCALGCSLPMFLMSLLIFSQAAIFWGCVALISAFYFFNAGPVLRYLIEKWQNVQSRISSGESGLKEQSIGALEEEMSRLREVVHQHMLERTLCPDPQSYILELKQEAIVQENTRCWNYSYKISVFGTISSLFLGLSLAVIFFIPSFLLFGVPLYKAREQGRTFTGFANKIGLTTLCAGLVAFGMTLQYFNSSLQNYDATGLAICLALGVEGNLSEPLADGNTYLISAIKNNKPDMVKLLATRGYGLNTANLRQQTPLHFAVENGNQTIIQTLVANGAEVNAKTDAGFTPLHFAAANANVSATEFLINNGADVNAADLKLNRPLHVAADKSNKEIVELLLKNKAVIDEKNAEGLTPLFYAIAKENLPVVKSLIEAGSKIDADEEDDESAFSEAISTRNMDIVKYIWSLRPQLSIAAFRAAMINNEDLALKMLAVYLRSRPGLASINRLLENAVEFGSARFVESVLQAGADPSCLVKSGFISNGKAKKKIRDGKTVPLLINKGFYLLQSSFDQVKAAILNDDEAAAVELVYVCNDVNHKEAREKNKTLLHYAVEKGQLDVVQALLTRGADTTAKWGSLFAETPVDTAIRKNYDHLLIDLAGLHLHLAITNGNMKMVRQEIRKNSSVVNKPDLEGKLPLHLAAFAGRLQIAEELILRGALVDQKDSSENTPLMLASDQGYEDIVRLLLEHGADVNASVGWGQETALMRASEKGHLKVVLELISRGAKLESGYFKDAIRRAEENNHQEIVSVLRKHFGK